jgi:hypothetical protein
MNNEFHVNIVLISPGSPTDEGSQQEIRLDGRKTCRTHKLAAWLGVDGRGAIFPVSGTGRRVAGLD